MRRKFYLDGGQQFLRSLLDLVDYVLQSSLTRLISLIEYFKIDILFHKMILSLRLFLPCSLVLDM